MEHLVYFLQRENGDIKIGTTKVANFGARVTTLMSKYGSLTTLGVMGGSYELESSLHARFFGCKIKKSSREELFHPCKELLAYIAEFTVPLNETPAWRSSARIAARDSKRIRVLRETHQRLENYARKLNLNLDQVINHLLDSVQ